MQIYTSSSVLQYHMQTKQNTLSQSSAVNQTLELFLILFIPSCLFIGAFLYKKLYKKYHDYHLKQQIKTLENLWQIKSITPKKMS